MHDLSKELDTFSNQVINKTLLIGSFLGLLSFIASLKFNIENNYIHFIISDFFVVLSFFLTSLFNKKLPIKAKSLIIVLGLFVLVFGSVTKVGIFADSKILLILIPIFAFIGYSFRTTVIIYSIAIISFILLGYFHISGIINTNVDLSHRALSITAWINNILLLSIVAFVVVIIIKRFMSTFVRFINDLKNKNSELEQYRNRLELLVKERTNKLESTNKKLQIINEELEITVNKLQSSQDNLIQAEKMASLGVLAAGVAHEINNPLNFIQGGISGIEIFFEDNLSKSQIKDISPLLDGIKEGVKRTSNIVTSLNHFSRTDNVATESCDIHAIIENCLVMLNNRLKHKIEIIKNFTESPINLECNDGKLHQVILNILSNAEQAIEKKGVIKISTFIDKEKITIDIKDTGSGIKEEIMSKISDPFFTTKEVGKGTGLGLSIAYKIVEENKGTIKHESKEGEGTKVTITFPVKK